MVIDLARSLEVLHSFWDTIGILVLGCAIVFIPIIVCAASALHIRDLIIHKLEDRRQRISDESNY